MAVYAETDKDFVLLLEGFGAEAAKGGVYISFPGCQSFYKQVSTQSDRKSTPLITPEEYDAIDQAFSRLGLVNKQCQIFTYFYYCIEANETLMARLFSVSAYKIRQSRLYGLDELFKLFLKCGV